MTDAIREARDPASRTIGRWELKKRGRGRPFRSPEVSGSIVEPKTRLDRLAGGNGPVRSIPISERAEAPAAEPSADLRHLASIWK